MERVGDLRAGVGGKLCFYRVDQRQSGTLSPRPAPKMTPARVRRMMLVVFMLSGIGIAMTLALAAFERNLLFFYTPTQIITKEVRPQTEFRIGGLVAPGSVLRNENELEVTFAVTDGPSRVLIKYNGILPDLFREGQGIVVRGLLGSDGVIKASEVLAKHDENYMPPEAAAALEAAADSNP